MHLLKPILETKFYYLELEEILAEYFKEAIYLPLLKSIQVSENKLENSNKSPLQDALRRGTVRFWRGEFRGKFSSQVSAEIKKLGGKWDRRTSSFRILLNQLPKSIQESIRISENQFNKKTKLVIESIDKLKPEKISQLKQISDFFDTKIFKLDHNITSSLEGIGVIPKVSKDQRTAIAAQYTENLSLYIKNFTDDEILKLRQEMKKHSLSGARYEDMIETIQKSYGVSKRKAHFLARQETGLMMAAFKEQRYKEAGVEGYIWRCVAGTKNHPVRPMHKALDGIFVKWDNPPIVNEKGDRMHAGEDFNCRCFAQPVVRF